MADTVKIQKIWVTQYEVPTKPVWEKRLKWMRTHCTGGIVKEWRDEEYSEAEQTQTGVVVLAVFAELAQSVIDTINREWPQAMGCQLGEVYETKALPSEEEVEEYSRKMLAEIEAEEAAAKAAASLPLPPPPTEVAPQEQESDECVVCGEETEEELVEAMIDCMEIVTTHPGCATREMTEVPVARMGTVRMDFREWEAKDLRERLGIWR